MADAIRRQAASQSKAAQVKKQKKTSQNTAPNPLDQLMQQIQNISVDPTPLDVLLKQATGTAGSQFDPLIQQLEAEMARTENRGKQNQATAKKMYGDLATDIAAQMPEITNQMAQASRETEQRYDQTQGLLKDQYNQQAQQQAELYKKLGIQAATPEATQQASDDQSYFQNQSKLDENAALQMLSEMKNSDVSYNRQSSDNTRLAGVNTAADIGAQLEDYMQTAGSKLTGLRSSKESAIQAMLAQLQQQDAERIQEQESTQYDQLMDLFNLQLKMQEMQQKNARESKPDQLFKGTNGPSGASNYLGEMYGPSDSFSSKAIMEALNDVMGSPEAVAGKYQSQDMKDSYGNPVNLDVTPEYLTDMLRRRMQEGNPNTPLSNPTFSDYDMNNAINALLAYMGKLK
ncbi:hypothetical protein [Streptomyces hebeiensis]